MWEVSGSVSGCQNGHRRVIYEAMTPHCGRSVVRVLVVRVGIGVGTYEAMTPLLIIVAVYPPQQ